MIELDLKLILASTITFLIALAILVVVIASFSVRRWLAAQDGAPRHAEATQRTR